MFGNFFADTGIDGRFNLVQIFVFDSGCVIQGVIYLAHIIPYTGGVQIIRIQLSDVELFVDMSLNAVFTSRYTINIGKEWKDVGSGKRLACFICLLGVVAHSFSQKAIAQNLQRGAGFHVLLELKVGLTDDVIAVGHEPGSPLVRRIGELGQVR